MTPPLRLVFWESTKACNLTCRHCRAVPQRTARTDRAADRGGVRSHRSDRQGRPSRCSCCRAASRCSGRTCSTSARTASSPASGWRSRPTARWSPGGWRRTSPTPASRASRSASTARCRPRTTRSAACPARTRSRCAACATCATKACRCRSTRRSRSTTSRELPALLDLALEIGADALHLFMLVPVGCGLEIAPSEMLPADEYERVLHWFDEQSKTCPIDLKATCAPHYYRIRAQRLEERPPQRRHERARSSRRARAPRRRRRCSAAAATASTCRR